MVDIDPADIPVVILAGGMGTRIREASEALPKPMIDVGGKPIVWHIMKTYAHYGHKHFVLLTGFKSWLIKEYFLRYRENVTDFTVDVSTGETVFHDGLHGNEDFKVTLAYTGLHTLTGGRLSRAREYIQHAPAFMLTYGDGVADIDLNALRERHFSEGRIGTVTAVHPTSRFGELETKDSKVVEFAEKPDLSTGAVNGGYFMFSSTFLEYVSDDSGMLESNALQRLTRDGELSYHLHSGFWRGMDTYREYKELNRLWDEGIAPWRVWSE
jgi:glucose-1-phosphate cytidylyltransferase